MNVLFISIAYPRSPAESNLYSDLMEEFASHGHTIYIACSIEKRFEIATNLTEANGTKVLRIQTGNITSNPNYITKGIALLQLQSKFIKAINNYFAAIKFDLILYSTPPIQYNRIISYLKARSNASTYLLLKDIFPQNAVDLGLLSTWNPVYLHFKKQEKETYRLSDRIGCMSPANVNYLLAHHPEVSPAKVEVCANSLKDRGAVSDQDRIAVRSKIRTSLSIGEDELVLIYGGNLGISQGLQFLMEILKTYSTYPLIRFLVVGEGTWYSRIEKTIVEGNYRNVILQQRVFPAVFKEMMLAADIGLIFLHPKFTIPNFPSRLTSYLEIGLPVIACTDAVSDVGDVVVKADCGYKVISGDIEGFETIIQQLLNKPAKMIRMSENARNLFIKSFTSNISYSTIISTIID